jgi:hypothetical protein
MSSKRNKKNQRGQMIIIAVGVMFLLAFIAGMFLTIITRNIARTARGGDVVQAQYLAEAGIRYADEQLTHSILGADWRPEPDLNPTVGDPDYEWLKAGYTRVNQGNGRFLLRVSFNPVKLNDDGQPVDADNQVTDDRSRMVYPDLAKYIKIEAIGRRGVVDSNDPTTWGNADPLRRLLVAYKPIGITDYARYITNKDRSDNTIVLGVFPFAYPQGSGNDGNFRTGIYGPVRVNGDLMWTGLDTVILNSLVKPGTDPQSYDPGNQYAATLADKLAGVNRNDSVAVAGRIFHDDWPGGNAPADQVTLLNMGGPNASTTPINLRPSRDADFTTAQGAYRDAASGQTAEGKLRAVARLEPPLMDQTEPSTGILRYRLLTRDTGIVPPNQNANTGQYGMGMGIYVDNANERQSDNQYRRLPDEWARTGTGRESGVSPDSAWRQNLYVPPGAEVYLDPTPSRALNSAFPANRSQGTIYITRHDGKQWRDETGREEGYTRRYRYPLRRVYNLDGTVADSEEYEEASPVDPFRDASGAYKTFQNGVIFMEGNIRLQGQLPPDWVGQGPDGDRVVGQNLTFVTMGTAYIEGNLLKGRAATGNINDFGAGLQVGSISVIAKDYVCVNTTAYFMKQPDSGPWNFALGNPYTELASAGERFSTSGYSAVDPNTYPDNRRGNKQEMFFLQTAESYAGAAADLRIYDASGAWLNPFGADTPMVVTPGQFVPGTTAEAIWQHGALPLVSGGTDRTSWNLNSGPLPDWMSLTYRPWAGLTPGQSGPGYYMPDYTLAYNKPLWVSRVATSPMDVRIEAVLYAQDGSFFIIPGEWLNTDANDVRGPTSLGSLRYNEPVQAGWRKDDVSTNNPSAYPFFAEPADIRVVINGAIAENLPADKDYQTAWAQHWGWSPINRPDGSTSAHDGEGLVYLYDNDLRVPLRYDKFNRPLPPMPALPVSSDLVFFGEASG